MASLRRRALLGAFVWSVLVFIACGAMLYFFIDTLVVRRFDEGLVSRHLQISIALSNSGDAERVEAFLTDPAYERPYSGRYWQILTPGGMLYTSRSLFDVSLTTPETAQQRVFWNGAGPNGPLRGLTEAVSLEQGGVWYVSVAETTVQLDRDRTQIRTWLVYAFILLGLFAVIAAVLQVWTVLAPLAALRREIQARWDSGQRIAPERFPDEVAPLVTDLNTLIDRNRETLERARRQAADLAHALKTPSAILRNELESIAGKGGDMTRATEALARIDAQIGRSLARVRAANHGALPNSATDARESAERLARVFDAMPGAEHITLTMDIAPGVAVPMDRQDFEEMLGNLLENAFKWARARVHLAASTSVDGVYVTVEDDGPGIPETQRREALTAGGRLDAATPGTGLGLAIVSDLVSAYGGKLRLDTSPKMAGLCAIILLPSLTTLARRD